ncbi:hypothetical protein [Hyalangium versicolor]|uniref:hypothetical protein n=1 Tax=Hyalangium versicolor TaxID=2861190 RepID=UPI001CCD557E|nr:hypothetical protein [Hyalangium versicolor]
MLMNGDLRWLAREEDHLDGGREIHAVMERASGRLDLQPGPTGHHRRAQEEAGDQVKGGKEITLTPGQTFYEGPSDIHVVGRNASKTKSAKFIVFLVKDKGAPVLVPVE